MLYLSGSKSGGSPTLAATFDSEEQLLAYVRWATLSGGAGQYKFEQGSVLARYQDYSYSNQPPAGADPETVDHNPSPSML